MDCRLSLIRIVLSMFEYKRSHGFVIWGAFWVALSVLIGAAGKHVLAAEEQLAGAELLNISSKYGMIMGLSLMVLTAMRWMGFWTKRPPWPERFLSIGLFLFSGGLCARAFVPESFISELLSPCIPFGGVLLSAAFVVVAIQTIHVLFVSGRLD